MIVLIVGDSGVGKSTIALKILENLENVNLVKSYTTRERRDNSDDDHIFIKDENEIDGEIVASTIIDGNFYGASDKQFKLNMINLYIVDEKGVLDIKKHFDDEIIITIKIERDSKNIKIPEKRKYRKIKKYNISYDEKIYNNNHINDAVEEVIECIRKYQKIS